jgi:hypothetical protein
MRCSADREWAHGSRWPMLFVLAGVGVPAEVQTRPELVAVYGSVAEPLPRVIGVAFATEGLTVLSAEGPAFHRFPGGARTLLIPPPGAPRGFHGAGEDRVMIHDAQTGALQTYWIGGERIASRELRRLARGGVILDARVMDVDTVVAVPADGNRGVALLRVAEDRSDTVAVLRAPDVVRLEAPGSPSYTVPRPYAPRDAWTVLPGGGVIYWRGDDATLTLVGRSGSPVTLTLPQGRHSVYPADREYWLDTAIPHVFMGQRPFESIREKARADLSFPQYFPSVVSLLPDPALGVWVQRTGAGRGELWVWLDSEGERARVRFEPGRELLTVSSDALAVRHRLRDGEFTVEIYEKPR